MVYFSAPIYFAIVDFIIIALTLLSNLLSIISVFIMKFRDFTMFLRIYIGISDIVFTVGLLVLLFLKNPYYDILYYFMVIYVCHSHGLWVFFLGFSMYKVICKKENFKFSTLHKFFVIIEFVSVICGIFATALIEISLDYYKLIFYLIFIITPDTIVFITVKIYYKKVINTIKTEINCKETNYKPKLMIIRRIYSFLIIFMCLVLLICLPILNYIFSNISDTFKHIHFLLLCLYPLLNSIFYGHTKSSLRALKSIFTGTNAFQGEEEFYQELRETGFIFPRYYYDLTGMSENQII